MLSRTLRSAAAVLSMAAIVLPMTAQMTAFGCLPGRFPVCEKNDDCKEAAGKVCSNLRCVQCGADSDCADGYCELKLGECKSLGAPGDAKPESSAAEPDASAAPPAE